MSTIQEAFKLKSLKGFESRHEKDEKMPSAERLVGLELEIENFDPEAEQRFPGFHFEADGSLRNSAEGIGIEAITAPVAISSAIGLLSVFYKKFEITESNYTERCSTHVHVNVMDMTADQLACLCLLYQATERLLFEYAGTDRAQSIFCVPWCQSGLTYNYVQKLIASPGRVKEWQKYSALNLLPVATQGSVEFRHLGGTCDLNKIKGWLAIIGCLFERAMASNTLQLQSSICDMNTISNYREWLSDLFGRYSEHFLVLPNYGQALHRGVVDCKVMLMQEKKTGTWDREAIERTYQDILRSAGRREAILRQPVAEVQVDPAPAWADEVDETWMDEMLNPPPRQQEPRMDTPPFFTFTTPPPGTQAVVPNPQARVRPTPTRPVRNPFTNRPRQG